VSRDPDALRHQRRVAGDHVVCSVQLSVFSKAPIADGKVGGVRVGKDPDALRHQRRVAEDHVACSVQIEWLQWLTGRMVVCG